MTFALIDGNNFYASCQMAFDPSLWHRPVVVLSNNDGCIVSANHLAKALDSQLSGPLGSGGYYAARGDSMIFQPYFKVKDLLKRHNTAVFSSNYELYADMSMRMHTVIGQFSDAQEIYSIDESFLNLSGHEAHEDLTELGWSIKHTVFQWLCLPVAVGIAPTKTLAKLANHLAKKQAEYDGVLNLNDLSEHAKDQWFKQLDVGKIWGVGKRLSARLKADGLHTVYDLKNAAIAPMRKKYSVQMERTIRELNGEACLQDAPVNHSQIISSRSFGTPVEHYTHLEQAFIFHASNAARKLRKKHHFCQMLTVYAHTDKHQLNLPQYFPHRTVSLPYPTQNSVYLAKQARNALQAIWQDGYRFKKAGVILSELSPVSPVQQNFLSEDFESALGEKGRRLMQLTDELNQKMGKHTLYLSSEGLRDKSQWQMRRDNMSFRYTTRWNELPQVS